jgi:holo-[acyl-carrier protein] synthase
MILGLGVDLFEVPRLEEELRKQGSDFGRELFTPAEIAYCEGQRYPGQHYAARFAAKEAVFKALGMDGRDGSSWREVEVRAGAGGERRVVLHGRVEELARGRGVSRVLVSLSHTRTLATACVVLES